MSNLIKQFLLFEELEDRPSYNVAPTQPVAVVRGEAEGGKRHLEWLRWGLIPSWAKDASIGSRMINARGETVAEKPSFRAAFKRRRCLVLADGYYEWKKMADGKQPFYIRRQDDRPFAFAGLWERWDKGEEPIESCTIITTEAAPSTQQVHDRMPVILDSKDYDRWLDPKSGAADMLELVRPWPNNDLAVDPVNRVVNNVRNNGPQCIEIVELEEE